MKKETKASCPRGNNPAPVAGVLDASDMANPKVPPHQPPITASDPEPIPPDARIGFIKQLANGFRQIPPSRFAYYHVAL